MQTPPPGWRWYYRWYYRGTLDIIEMLIMFCFLANQHWGDPFGARAFLHDRNPWQNEERLQSYEGAISRFSLTFKYNISSVTFLLRFCKNSSSQPNINFPLWYLLEFALWTSCFLSSVVCLFKSADTWNFRHFLEWCLFNKMVFPAVCWSTGSVLCLCHVQLRVKCEGAIDAFRSLWLAHNTQNENNCIIGGQSASLC